jgi:glycosyltransferase involved in cell wall biosynthesis
LKPEDKVVGTIGWLLPIKGPMVLLKAFHRLTQGNGHPLKLVFVGKGEMENKLQKEASRAGMAERVKFLGWRDDIPDILPLFDIFVLASLNEGMGRVLVEAMAAERPIVASAVGGISDLVKNEENGLLVPPGDDAALARALTELIKNPDKARRLGANGRLLSHEYSLEAMIDKIDTLYTEMLASVDRGR